MIFHTDSSILRSNGKIYMIIHIEQSHDESIDHYSGLWMESAYI